MRADRRPDRMNLFAATATTLTNLCGTTRLKAPDSRQDPIDEWLAIRCQLGERDAFDALARRWSGPLQRYVSRVAGGESCDDLVQEIWLRALQGMGRLQDCSRFRAWLFGIAHRVLMDRWRRHYRFPVRTEVDPEALAFEETSAEHALMAKSLDTGLARLPPLEREVLTLFYLEELPLNEVAAVLQVPPGTVKSRLFRARRQLRDALSNPEISSCR
jgi:RNA polymerase sigma factor (sigma-70 family)